MDTSKLKPFAQEARRTLRAQVSARLDLVLADQSAARREQPKAVAELESEICRTDRDQVVERVAYTWFNRFTALRFMDANGYTRLKVVSPSEDQTRPEILAEAAAGNVDDEAPAAVREKVAALLDGRTPSADAQGEAYRLLLVAACNQWHATMPFMFEKIADYTELLLPEDLLSSDSLLGKVRAVMTEEACQDVEIIGWLYQFYISEKKDEVFAGLKRNKKISAENIPAATQLFTPHWIVRYLVENSLGRLWLLNRPNSKLATKMDFYIAPEEAEYIAPEEAEADFLRISRPEDIRICDPACGSGHMLTYAFDLLHAIYEEEGYDAAEIPALILKHNLHGIEIDDRAGGLAAFALAMKAATKLGRRRFLRQAVQPNICVLQDVRFTPSEMQDVAAVVGGDLFTADLRDTLEQFENAKNFGSLIVPKLHDPAEVARVVRSKEFSGDLLLREVKKRVLSVLAMAEALTSKYYVVVANPPYMGGKGMNGKLQEYAKTLYPDSKSDLFAMFMERILELSISHGLAAIINMQSWMFLSSFEKLRKKLNSKSTFITMAHLGERAFDSIGGAVVSTTAFVLENAPNPERPGCFIRVTDGNSEAAKARCLREAAEYRECGWFFTASVKDFEKIPGSPIAYWLQAPTLNVFDTFDQLKQYAHPRQGMATTNNDLFLRQWFEVGLNNSGYGLSPKDAINSNAKWFPVNKGGEFRRWYGNNSFVVNYENRGRAICEYIDNTPDVRVKSNGRVINRDRYFVEGLTWSTISTGDFALRFSPQGSIFETKGAMIFFDDSTQTKAVLGILNTKITSHLLKATSPTLDFHEGPIGRLPILMSEKTVNCASKLRAERAVELSKSDWDSFETSWEFAALPLLSPEHRGETLAVSYTRLRAYWQGKTDELQELEEENNRIFIEAYGLQNELTPEVPMEEVTLSCNPTYRYGVKAGASEIEARLLADTVAEFLHYAVGCMFGRYSLDEPGLILANRGEGLAEYLARVPHPTFEPDADNVIPVLDGEWFADDIAERFRKFLRVTFGEVKFQENLAFIEGALGKDIRKWFTRDFYEYHVRRYKKRPIYWMFASPKGSFQALIYMHRYRPDTVSVVLNDYLREYRNKLEAHRKAQEALSISTEATPAQRAKALKEIGEISKVIDELDGYERDLLFPLATQKIEIDLDDGVKANYPKFGAALKPIKGLGDADD